MILLRKALAQTKWKGEMPSEDNWRVFLGQIVKQAQWQKVKKDVEGFLENPSDMDVFSQENMLKLLKAR